MVIASATCFGGLELSVEAGVWDATFESTYPGQTCGGVLAYGGTVYAAGVNNLGHGFHSIFKWTSTSGWTTVGTYQFDGEDSGLLLATFA